MRFDVGVSELRRVTGIRNIRQALASPYPVSTHDPGQLVSVRARSGCFRTLGAKEGMIRFSRLKRH